MNQVSPRNGSVMKRFNGRSQREERKFVASELREF